MQLLFLIMTITVLSISGCETYKLKDKPIDQTKVEIQNPILANDIDMILQYSIYIKRLTPVDLNREYETVKQKPKSDRSKMELAMIYALPGLTLHDDAKALAILESLAKESASLETRNFAALLTSLVGENKRLDEGAQALSSKLKDEQKQSGELQQKLDAITSIEKSLSDRDRLKKPGTKK